MKMKYKKVTNLSSERTKFFKHLMSSMRNYIHRDEEKSHDIFTLPSHALPSQYKTLLPVTDLEIERILTLERRRQFIRNATLLVSAIIVCFIVIVITLIIVLQLSLNETKSRGPLRLTAVHVNRTQFQVDEIKLLKTKALVKQQEDDSEESHSPDSKGPAYRQGVQCTAKCWEYAAFRFKAECVNGYCLCRDKNYDSLTCLPKTSDCSIRRHQFHPSFQAVRFGRVQPSYSCAPKKEIPSRGNKKTINKKSHPSRSRSSPEIHVISIMGNNKDTRTTKLHFKSSTQVNATLILVSYEPVTWNITLDRSVYTENIVLISHYGVSRTQVKIANYPSSHHTIRTGSPSKTPSSTKTSNSTSQHGNNKENGNDYENNDNDRLSSGNYSSGIPAHELLSSPIQIKRLLIRTGYGDDRDSGNTPFLLEEIREKIGPISSFFGVAHADDIVFDIGLGNYELNSLDDRGKDAYSTAINT